MHSGNRRTFVNNNTSINNNSNIVRSEKSKPRALETSIVSQQRVDEKKKKALVRRARASFKKARTCLRRSFRRKVLTRTVYLRRSSAATRSSVLPATAVSASRSAP